MYDSGAGATAVSRCRGALDELSRYIGQKRGHGRYPSVCTGTAWTDVMIIQRHAAINSWLQTRVSARTQRRIEEDQEKVPSERSLCNTPSQTVSKNGPRSTPASCAGALFNIFLKQNCADRFQGFDHGVGHSLLLLYDAKASYSKNSNDFNGLGHYPFNTLYKFILN